MCFQRYGGTVTSTSIYRHCTVGVNPRCCRLRLASHADTGAMPILPPVAPVIDQPTCRLIPANQSLRYLEAGALAAARPDALPSRPAVPDIIIASSRLLSCIDPMPLDISDRQYYGDGYAAHLSECAGAWDAGIPLMVAETFPRLEGGVRASLEEYAPLDE